MSVKEIKIVLNESQKLPYPGDTITITAKDIEGYGKVKLGLKYLSAILVQEER